MVDANGYRMRLTLLAEVRMGLKIRLGRKKRRFQMVHRERFNNVLNAYDKGSIIDMADNTMRCLRDLDAIDMTKYNLASLEVLFGRKWGDFYNVKLEQIVRL